MALLAVVLAAGSPAFAAAPPPAFGDKTLPPAELAKARDEVPPPLRQAVDFQRLLQKIRAGAPVAEWKPEMALFLNAPASDPVAKSLVEVAKIWLARASMTQIDAALRKYYRKSVSFPDTLLAVKGDIPAEAQDDPWGQPWVYKPAVPHGLGKLSKQRYQLGPTRLPNLSPLADAIDPESKPATFKLTMRDVGGSKAVELRTADGQTAILQAGGRSGEFGVVYIGDGWVLLADTERLFSVAF
jgi:hypothetical protein